MKKLFFTLMLLVLLGSGLVTAQSILNQNGGPLSLSLTAEYGFVKVFFHEIQIGDPGTNFDYVKEGGQEILFPFGRFTGELSIKNRHTIIYLYQPLEFVRTVRFDEIVTVDGVDFPANQGVEVRYSFPFYRTSYLYDFFPEDHVELAAGISLQLRNATIGFVSTEGEEISVSQDLGPVPIIKIRSTYRFPNSPVPGAFVGIEADGFYASSKFINGADYEFSGSIFDISLRTGFSPRPGLDLYANLRSVGGGANGTRPDDERKFWSQSRNGFTDNFLVTGALTFGVRLY